MAFAREMAGKLLQRYPWTTSPLIVGAPMRVMAGPALAVAISRAGGLGFIGPGASTEDTNADLKTASALIRDASHPSAAFPSSTEQLPIGVGYQLWADNLGVAVAGIAAHPPSVAWFFAPSNSPADYDTWSRQVRLVSPATQIWIQVGTLREAKLLLHIAEKPDAVVVQGAEAGGHGRAHDGLGLMTLLPEIIDAMKGSQIPVLAAGGIADGRGVAAAVCLGAAGVVMGTRFLASTEARIRRGYQDEVVRASDGAASTTRTLLYNHLRGTYGWPEGYSPRTIINRTFRDQQDGKSFQELQKLHDEAADAGDAGWGPEGRLATYAGASIGLVHDVRDAAAIVQDVRREYKELVGTLQ